MFPRDFILMPSLSAASSPSVPLGVRAALARALLVAIVCALLAPGLAWGQGGGVPEDDPFADELSPFGRRPDKAPPAEPGDDSTSATPKAREPNSPAGQTPRPQPRLPVPFPETTLPGAPAERGSSRDRVRVAPRTTPDDGSETRDEWEPTPAENLVAEAERLDLKGDLEGARGKLRAAIKLDPKLTIAHLALGVVSRRLGDFEGCVAACSSGLAIDPQDPELYLRRGIAWFHLGLYGIALEDFEDAAGIAYDDPRPELWRGLTLMELERPLEAINAYASSIRRDRTFMLAYLNRGLAYLRTGQPRKAEFDFDQSIRHDPRDVRGWFNRGVAQAQQGKFAAAANSYNEALKRDPAHEPTRRNLEAIRGRADRP